MNNNYFNNKWLLDEEIAVDRESKRALKLRDSEMLVKALFFAVFFAVFAWTQGVYGVQHTDSNTWRCLKCGYENMNGINRCGVCGTQRGHSWSRLDNNNN